MKKGNLILSGAFASIAVVMLFLVQKLPDSKHGVPGPATWPIIIAVMTLVAAISLAIQTFKTKSADGDMNLKTADSLRVYGSIGILVAYLGCLYFVGFAVSTFLMLYGFITWFGSYRWYLRLLSALCITAVVYGVFHYLLKVPFRFGLLF